MSIDNALPEILAVRWPAGSPAPPPDTDAAIDRAVGVLRAGGVVAIPTETVYGLAGLALSDAAVERIFIAKGRPDSNPLIVHVDGVGMARGLASSWPESAERIARACWPGPVTVVVPKQARVPDAVTAGGATVALRCPDHPIARRLIERLGEPLAAPSANRSQRLSPTTAAHVLEGLGPRVDLILDAGPCSRGIESTVVDCTVSPPVILRPGPLTAAALESVLSLPAGAVATGATAADGTVERSPGRASLHYAPRTPLEICAEGATRVAELLRQGRRVGWMTTDAVSARTRRIGASPEAVVVPMPAAPAAYATLLFAMLHAIDKRSLDVIVVDAPPADDAWDGIRDRLERAAARRGGEEQDGE